MTFNEYGIIEKKRFWNFPEFYNSSMNYNEAKNAIENEIQDSVKEQLMSDVPIGAFLIRVNMICHEKKNKSKEFQKLKLCKRVTPA